MPMSSSLPDVAAQGAAVDAQARRQLGAAHAAMGLQQLQQGEHAGGRMVHRTDYDLYTAYAEFLTMEVNVNATATLWLYFILVLGIIALPGLDMAYVLANALTGGRGAGLAAVAGIVAGGVCHIAMGALGVAAIVQLWPALFNLLLVAGAAYIGWIGWQLARAPARPRSRCADAPARPAPSVFLKGMLTCLLNPKAYVFMLAMFPQFLIPVASMLLKPSQKRRTAAVFTYGNYSGGASWSISASSAGMVSTTR
jgi:threonine/homoserine/homoserine lactone efflux protein